MATKCPITRSAFHEAEKKITVVIEGVEYECEPRENSSTSLGWGLNAKAFVVIDGVKCPVQIGMNVTLIGSGNLDS